MTPKKCSTGCPKKTKLQKAKEKLLMTLEDNLPPFLSHGWIQNEINKLIKIAKKEALNDTVYGIQKVKK